jgi:hypothetical protein
MSSWAVVGSEGPRSCRPDDSVRRPRFIPTARTKPRTPACWFYLGPVGAPTLRGARGPLENPSRGMQWPGSTPAPTRCGCSPAIPGFDIAEKPSPRPSTPVPCSPPGRARRVGFSGTPADPSPANRRATPRFGTTTTPRPACSPPPGRARTGNTSSGFPGTLRRCPCSRSRRLTACSVQGYFTAHLFPSASLLRGDAHRSGVSGPRLPRLIAASHRPARTAPRGPGRSASGAGRRPDCGLVTISPVGGRRSVYDAR